MFKIVAMIVLAQWSIVPMVTTTEIDKSDPRPPSVSVELTRDELAALEAKEKAVENAQIALDKAKSEESTAKYEISKKHSPDNKPWYSCGETHYQGEIVRRFIVYTLASQQCRAA
jgi:hypothetical protein